jgi:hypothetical protein
MRWKGNDDDARIRCNAIYRDESGERGTERLGKYHRSKFQMVKRIWPDA